jgi:hypothetical protein
MEGQISSHVLGVEAVSIVKSGQSIVVRVMKLAIDSADLDWTQEPDDNPNIAMIPFVDVFAQPVGIGDALNITGQFQLQHILPATGQQRIIKQKQLADQRLMSNLQHWLKRYGKQDQFSDFERLMKRFLNNQLDFSDLMIAFAEILGSDDVAHSPRLKKLQTSMQSGLKLRQQVNQQAPLVLWVSEAEMIDFQSEASTSNDGPLTVIRLDGHSIDESWAKWQQKMTASNK